MNLGQIAAIAGGLIAVALVVVIVASPNTASIITAATTGFIGALQAAMGSFGTAGTQKA